jgi:prepilin-type N-terminal cleavage/methylation domain-containing protein
MSPARDHGFTLLETLVALAVFAFIAAAFTRGLDIGAKGTRLAEREATAVAIAKASLAAAGTEIALTASNQTVAAGGGMFVTTSVTPYRPGQAAADDASDSNLFRVDVRVDWRAAPGERRRSVELSTLKRAPSP